MRIEWFSGMGNSAHVARRLGELLADERPEEILFVFPVYSWGVPPVMVRHIEGMGLSGLTAHMVCTCGDDTGRIDRQWSRLVQSRGGRVGGIYSVQMPNSYVCIPGFDVDSPQVRDGKLAAAEPRLLHIAGRIRSGATDVDICRGWLPGLKSALVYPLFFRWMKASKFHATAVCTGCGACARSCPQHNIAMDGRTPRWGADCAFCLRCYHQCPRHAVSYGRVTALKGQYLHPDFKRIIK